MAKKRKAPKPEAKVPLDPKATVFQAGDYIEVKRRVLWSGYRGFVDKVDGGMCRCRLMVRPDSSEMFDADIPATELKLDL